MWQLNTSFMSKFGNDNWRDYLYVVLILVITPNQIKTKIVFGLRGKGWKRKESESFPLFGWYERRERSQERGKPNPSEPTICVRPK